jgi:hypothetical protein
MWITVVEYTQDHFFSYTSHRPWSWGVVFDCVRREKSVNSVAKVKCKMGKQVMAVNRSVAAVMATV